MRRRIVCNKTKRAYISSLDQDGSMTNNHLVSIICLWQTSASKRCRVCLIVYVFVCICLPVGVLMSRCVNGMMCVCLYVWMWVCGCLYLSLYVSVSVCVYLCRTSGWWALHGKIKVGLGWQKMISHRPKVEVQSSTTRTTPQDSDDESLPYTQCQLQSEFVLLP